MKTKDFFIELANKMPDEHIEKLNLNATCGKFMVEVKKQAGIPASVSVTSTEEIE
jgi:hypothetical protein